MIITITCRPLPLVLAAPTPGSAGRARADPGEDETRRAKRTQEAVYTHLSSSCLSDRREPAGGPDGRVEPGYDEGRGASAR
jgi:hypothetical protein